MGSWRRRGAKQLLGHIEREEGLGYIEEREATEIKIRSKIDQECSIRHILVNYAAVVD